MKKRCFVIQGFGKKQDYEQGKQFNLDASYQVIKEAIEKTGLECHRADELRTNAIIDQVMYDQLLDADLVVADITTLNFNAGFELGVRFALRPYATLVFGEQGMNFPFDVKNIYIHKYQHLGEDIGAKEAKRLGEELKKLVKEVISKTEKDSPVYTYLKRLPEEGFLDYAISSKAKTIGKKTTSTLRDLIDKAIVEMDADNFDGAIKYWTKARKVAGKDDYIVQQLALAIYKSKKPSLLQALRKAKTILEYLMPHESFDTETLGLWGSIHKRLYEITKNERDLEEALFALERGYFIKKDYYTGINLAFMLDAKALKSVTEIKEELHASARQVRRNVKEICKKTLKEKKLRDVDKFWVLVTLYQACVGLDEEKEALSWKEKAKKISTPKWMIISTEEQIKKLRKLLKN
jgi:hypothetical protein